MTDHPGLPPLPSPSSELSDDFLESIGNLERLHAAYGRQLRALMQKRDAAVRRRNREEQRRQELEFQVLLRDLQLRRSRGESYARIGIVYGCTDSRIQKICEANGIQKFAAPPRPAAPAATIRRSIKPERPKGRARKLAGPEVAADLRRRVEAGEATKTIAAAYGVCEATVEKELRRLALIKAGQRRHVVRPVPQSLRSMVGQRYGLWLVLDQPPHFPPGTTDVRKASVVCRCTGCGVEKPVLATNLTKKLSQGCRACAMKRRVVLPWQRDDGLLLPTTQLAAIDAGVKPCSLKAYFSGNDGKPYQAKNGHTYTPLPDQALPHGSAEARRFTKTHRRRRLPEQPSN